MAKISIIIPTYKPGEYLKKCISSIASQSCKDYELVIVLNGCNEPYKDQIKTLLNNYNLQHKSQIIQTDQPGVSNARNIGIDNASGEYITFVDDDDYISSHYLSSMLDIATKDSIVISNLKRIRNNRIDNHKYTLAYEKLKDEGFKNYYHSRKVLNGPWMKLFPRNIIDEVKFDTEISLGEDALFNFIVSKNAKYLKASSPEGIYYYNDRAGSSWSNIKKMILFKQMIKLLSKYIKVYVNNPLNYDFFYFCSRILGISYTFLNRIIKI